MIESDDDLALFTNPDEFGTEAVLDTDHGEVPLSGVIDSYQDTERPGTTSNSGRSPFSVGAADVSLQVLQMIVPWRLVCRARAENTLRVPSGPYTGAYRIKTPERDGELCRLILTKQRQ